MRKILIILNDENRTTIKRELWVVTAAFFILFYINSRFHISDKTFISQQEE